MGWSTDLRQVREELRSWVERRLAQLFVYTLTSNASAIGDGDAVESFDGGADPGDPNSEKSQRSVTRIQPFGLRSVQPKKLRGLTLRLGVSNMLFIGIAPTTAYGPQDLGSGDAALYSSGAAQVRATGDDVIVNGGGAKVGRVGDNLTSSSILSAWASVVETAINSLAPGTFTPLNNWAGAGTPAPANVAYAGNLGTINSGADHFKG